MTLKDFEDAYREYPNKLRAMSNAELMNEGSFVFQGKSNFKINKVREEVYRRKQAGNWKLPKDGFVRTGFIFEVVTRVSFSRHDLSLLMRHASPSKNFDDLLDLFHMKMGDKDTTTLDLTIHQLTVLIDATRVGTPDELAGDILRAFTGHDPPASRDLRVPEVGEKADLNDKFWRLRDEAVARQGEINTIR